MRRRDLISLLAATVVACPFATLAQPPNRIGDIGALQKARRAYGKISRPNEAARLNYVTLLVRMRENVARKNTGEWQAIDAEIKQHPAPNDSDSTTFSSLRVGEWRSPRHDYLYRGDGTWTMLPAEENITHGNWRIEGNQYFDTAASAATEADRYTIILITGKDFVFANQTDVFYETRLR